MVTSFALRTKACTKNNLTPSLWNSCWKKYFFKKLCFFLIQQKINQQCSTTPSLTYLFSSWSQKWLGPINFQAPIIALIRSSLGWLPIVTSLFLIFVFFLTIWLAVWALNQQFGFVLIFLSDCFPIDSFLMLPWSSFLLPLLTTG